MRFISFKVSKILLLVLIGSFALSACGGGSPDADLANQDSTSASDNGDIENTDAGENSADDFFAEGTSLEGVNVCELIPLEEISSVVGALREDETHQEVSLAGEAACKYIDQQGHWYYVTYYPLSDWGFADLTIHDAVKMDGLLDGAWKGTYSSDEIEIKALAADEMVIGAFVSNGLEETAVSLIKLAYEYRPGE